MAKAKTRPREALDEELGSGGVRKKVDRPGEVLDPRGPVPTTG